MVCAKCEAADRSSNKTVGLACTDVWKPNGAGSDQRNERKVGSNKLLEAKRRYSAFTPVAGSAVRKGAGGSTSVGSAKRGASGMANVAQPYPKCKVCKVTVAKENATYCHKCAFKAGVCAICETQILDTSQYKMSAK